VRAAGIAVNATFQLATTLPPSPERIALLARVTEWAARAWQDGYRDASPEDAQSAAAMAAQALLKAAKDEHVAERRIRVLVGSLEWSERAWRPGFFDASRRA